MEEFANFFSLFHWFQLRPGPAPDVYWGFVAFYVLGLVASAAYFFTVLQRFGEHTYRMTVARRVALAGGILCALGLAFVAGRFLGILYLSLRVWVYVTTIGTVGLGAYLVYYFLLRYPTSLQAFDAEQLRQRYLPRPKSKAAAAGPRRRKRAR